MDPFEGESTTHAHYPRHELERREARDPPKHSPSRHKFDGVSTTNEAYREWPLPPHEPKPAARPMMQMPFEGESTTHATYRRHELERQAQA